MDAGHVLLGPWGGFHLAAPVRTEVEGQVLLQRRAPVELGERDRPHHGVIGELADLLLHGAIHKPEISHQGAVAGLINHPLEKAAHKARVLGHGVGLLRPLSQLESKVDSHSGKAEMVLT